MKNRSLPRRIAQYVAGLVCMAIGLTLLKRTVWGVSPITALPDAVTNIFLGTRWESLLSLGNTTIALHFLCVCGQVLVQKRVTLKSVLCLCVGIPFGKLVDLFLALWHPTLCLWQKLLALVLGIAIQGFGVALISGCDLMLPAPDELNNVISRVTGKKLSVIKRVADGIYVLLALLVNLGTWLLAPEKLVLSVGISSVASVLGTGYFVGLTFRLLPGARMDPFFTASAPAPHPAQDPSDE